MRGEATRINTKITTDLDSLTVEEKISCKERIEKLRADFEIINEEISKCLFVTKASDEVKQSEYDSCRNYDETLAACFTKLKGLIPKPSGGRQPEMEYSRNALKLPHMPLPEYGHKEGEDLHKFLINFENVIAKYNLSSYEKFVYLQRQLSNEPLVIIKSLEIGRQTYEDAKDLLQKAFASTTVLQYRVIKQLADLKMGRTDDPYEFISKMRMITESFATLNVSTDTVLQCFFWNGMNEGMQQQFIHITNTNKPDLEQIKLHTFEAAERYTAIRKTRSNKETVLVSAAAAAVDPVKELSRPKGKYCNWCTGKGDNVNSHSSFECQKYPTAEAKRTRIESLNGCIKCGNVHHPTNSCRFKFRQRCLQCNQWHFRYLCVATKKNDTQKKEINKKTNANEKNKTSKDSPDVHSGSIFMGKVSVQQYGEDAIVPTFSVHCYEGHTVRGMRDSGCQANLITQKCAEQLNLKIISDEFPLKINGFNQSTKHNVKIVELKINPQCPPVKTLCVPAINVKIKLSGLSELARSFEEKGYELADKTLPMANDEISDLDIVLGNNDAHVLPQTEVLFGSGDPSVYSKTPMGIMLLGSIHRMRKNLEELPIQPESVECEIRSCDVEAEFGSIPPMINDDIYCAIYDNNGEVDERKLIAASESILKNSYFASHQYFPETDDNINNTDARITQYVLDNATRDESGRLQLPLLWREEVSHLLASNLKLSKQVLNSNLKRLQNNPERLNMYDAVIKEQVALGIIEQVHDLPQFLAENPNASFLPHMGVFRLDHQSTKCRVVYLSNLAEKINKSSPTISHNQAMLSGPNLNRKITTAILKLRFDKFLLCFDLQKAFLSIALPKVDQNRLLFLWYKNVSKGDFSIVAYKNLRLPFGLRCSPALLMISLYKILIVDAASDAEDIKNAKKLIYDLLYMDNGCITTNNSEELHNYLTLLEQIFAPYQFRLQQFVTNDVALQQKLDDGCEEETPKQVKLLGLKYNREADTISTAPLHLDGSADTKRKILSSLAGNFDLFQFSGPILNRARLFVHQLQCEPKLGWDSIISDPQVREWKCISKQVNASVPISIKRLVGDRVSTYRMITFTDASKVMLGAVIYIQDLSNGEVNFLIAKNRIVNKQLETKSIPTLELQAVAFGIDTLMDTYRELTSDKSVVPINVVELKLYSDSMVSLNWINKYVNKLDKMQKCPVFIKNRLEAICKQCSTMPVMFSFISGIENPADVITRPISYKQLIKTNYHTGPSFLKKKVEQEFDGVLSFRVPNPLARVPCSVQVTGAPAGDTSVQQLSTETVTLCNNEEKINTDIIPFHRFSNFQQLVRVFRSVFKYVHALKHKVAQKKKLALESTKVLSKFSEVIPEQKEVPYQQQNLFNVARNYILLVEQKKYFPEVFQYFNNKLVASYMPNIVSQLNIFRDESDLLRVRSKFREWGKNALQFPVLLPRASPVMKLIVNDYHERMAHAGCFSLLTQLRKEFHIPRAFVTIKKILSECITCRKQNARTVKLNQSFYRDFRERPTNIPYRDIFIDHFGPFAVYNETKQKTKVWVLCITCLWSRAINLKVCYNLSLSEFLRTFQLHIFEYGLPERTFSDLGTQLVAGANVISDYLKDLSTQLYFQENNIKSPVFQQFYKGHKALGSLVESCVKISKKVLYSAMGKKILPHLQFELLVAQSVNIVNKRPVAFKECLQNDCPTNLDVPSPITPELLLRGYDLPSICIIPNDYSPDNEWKPTTDPVDKIKDNYEKLSTSRQKLVEIYRDEFLSTLIHQAVDKKDRFKPVLHRNLKLNDIVLLKEDNTKRINFPMGIVKKVVSNELGEVTSVEVKKGKSGEILKRHASSLIPILSYPTRPNDTVTKTIVELQPRTTQKRAAAISSSDLTKKMCQEGVV